MRIVEARAGAIALLATMLLVAGCGKQSQKPGPHPGDDSEPGKPGPITATLVCDEFSPQISLAWAKVPGAESYSLERDGALLAGIDDADAVSYRDATVAAGASYMYQLTAVNSHGETSGDPLTVTVPFDECLPAGTRIAAGGNSSYAVAKDGSLWSWGSNDVGQLGIDSTEQGSGPAMVPDLENVVSVAAGEVFVLALDSSGVVWSSGDNGSGQLGVDPGVVNHRPRAEPIDGLPAMLAISAGDIHALALARDGTVWGWGDNYYGQLGLGHDNEVLQPSKIDGLSDVVAVFAVGESSYAVHGDGTVSAWGSNDRGQLGLGDMLDRWSPEPIGGVADIVSVAGAWDHALLLAADGAVWGMGRGDSLPTAAGTYELSPVLMPGLDSVAYLATGFDHGLAVLEDGSIVGWGYNDYRQIIDTDDYEVTTPAPVPGVSGAIAVAAGELHSLALTADGEVLAWGRNTEFQLGLFNINDSFGLIPVELQDTVSQAAAGDHALVLLDDGTVWAWGPGEAGELGNGAYLDTGIPQKVQFPDGVTIRKVVAGKRVSLAIDTDGELWFWGYNYYDGLGQPGEEDYISVPAMVPRPVALEFKDVAVGNWSIMAVDEIGDVWGWGFNQHGQLGFGDGDSRDAPERVPTLASVASIAMGDFHSAALLDNGEVWSAGSDAVGQLGNGDPMDSGSSLPVRTDFAFVAAVAAGQDHSIAVHTNGDLSVWGSNTNGQLGVPGGHSPLPVPVLDLVGTEIEQVAAARYSSMALSTDGRLYAWGDNREGQLGIEGSDTIAAPELVPVPGTADIDQIVMGQKFSLVVADGLLYATGSNEDGQLGQGRVLIRGVPEAVGGVPPVGVP